MRVILSISGLADGHDLIVRRPPCVAERVFGVGAIRIEFERSVKRAPKATN
jgi:hypothetical protein